MKKILPLLLLHLFILFIFVCNGLYVSYPDEHVNLLGGKVINAGGLPYRDFFDHHLPYAWELSAALLKVSLNNFVLFRAAWAGLAFVLLAGLGLYIRRKKPDMYPYYLFFFFLYPFFTVYFWLHLFIADALACLFFSMTFWLTLVETWKQKSNITALMAASLINFILLFSSLTFLFVAIALYIWQFYLVLRNHQNVKDIAMYIALVIFPFTYFLVHLLVTGTFTDFWSANYSYNAEHYIHIKNYTPDGFFNPIKFAGAIIHNFYDQYLPLLTTVKHFDLYLPILTLAAWSTLMLLILFFFENKFLFILYFIILSFSAPRSSISKYSETDYQMGLFLTLGLISAFVVLYKHKQIQFKDALLNTSKTAAMVIVVLFTLFTTIFLIKNTFDKAFLRYTGFMPGISHRSHVSRFIDQIVKPGEYYWFGPYEPHHLFPVNTGRLPGKYPTLLPQFRESEFYSKDFVKQFEETRPIIIIFKHQASVFATPADIFGKFFINWMKGKYITLEELPGYQELHSPEDFVLRGDLYINKDHQEEVLKRLMDGGYVGRL